MKEKNIPKFPPGINDVHLNLKLKTENQCKGLEKVFMITS